MTEEDLDQIDALLARTSAGRWLAVEMSDGAPATNVLTEDHAPVASCEREGDAAFIAQSPLLVERLVAALRAAWAREDMMLREREKMR